MSKSLEIVELALLGLKEEGKITQERIKTIMKYIHYYMEEGEDNDRSHRSTGN